MEVAVCIPAYNEEEEIGRVVKEFKSILPHSSIYVYDNNSTDNTRKIALSAGAIVRKENRQGKGYVVKRMLSDIEADVYLLVDGDATYDHRAAPGMVQTLVDNKLDMVVGARMTANRAEFRRGHYTGNRIFTKLVGTLFSAEIKDLLSGYRVLSKRFVKSFPVSSKGFEIESEMTIQCLEMNLPFLEVDTTYKNRGSGSKSKLRTFTDGFAILLKIILLLQYVRPFLFFGTIGLSVFICGLILFIPVLIEYLNTGLVPRFPSLIVAVGLFIFALVNLACGVILSSVATGRLEAKKLAFLSSS